MDQNTKDFLKDDFTRMEKKHLCIWPYDYDLHNYK